jgi:hypothetical protein
MLIDGRKGVTWNKAMRYAKAWKVGHFLTEWDIGKVIDQKRRVQENSERSETNEVKVGHLEVRVSTAGANLEYGIFCASLGHHCELSAENRVLMKSVLCERGT